MKNYSEDCPLLLLFGRERNVLILSLQEWSAMIFSFSLSPEISYSMENLAFESWLNYQFSLHHSYICSRMVRRICIMRLGVKWFKMTFGLQNVTWSLTFGFVFSQISRRSMLHGVDTEFVDQVTVWSWISWDSTSSLNTWSYCTWLADVLYSPCLMTDWTDERSFLYTGFSSLK